MKKNKFACLLLSAVAVSTILSGCSSTEAQGGEDPAENNQSVTSQADSQQQYKIGFATKYLAGSSFWTALTDAAEQALHEGDQYVLYNSQEDIPTQISQIEDLIANEYDAIIVSCADTEAINATLQEAKDAGIVVVTVDSSCTDDSLFYTEVMNDNVTAATLCAEELLKSMDRSGKAICYYDTMTNQSIAKGQTVQDMLEAEGIEVIHVDGLGHADEALEKIEAALQANPDVTAVHTYNGPSAEGAISALQSAGILDKVMVTTIDGSESDVTNLKAGKLHCFGTQNPADMGRLAMESIYKALAGETLEKTTLCPTKLITKDNVDTFTPF